MKGGGSARRRRKRHADERRHDEEEVNEMEKVENDEEVGRPYNQDSDESPTTTMTKRIELTTPGVNQRDG